MFQKEPDQYHDESNKMDIEILYNDFEKIRKTVHSVIVTHTYILFDIFPMHFYKFYSGSLFIG